MTTTENPTETSTPSATATTPDAGRSLIPGNTLGNAEGYEVVVNIGRLTFTAAVHQWRAQGHGRHAGLVLALARHEAGQWGEVDAEDRAANDEALREGERLLSAWDVEDRRVWIITEPIRGTNRGVTTVLFPEDY